MVVKYIGKNPKLKDQLFHIKLNSSDIFLVGFCELVKTMEHVLWNKQYYKELETFNITLWDINTDEYVAEAKFPQELKFVNFKTPDFTMFVNKKFNSIQSSSVLIQKNKNNPGENSVVFLEETKGLKENLFSNVLRVDFTLRSFFKDLIVDFFNEDERTIIIIDYAYLIGSSFCKLPITIANPKNSDNKTIENISTEIYFEELQYDDYTLFLKLFLKYDLAIK